MVLVSDRKRKQEGELSAPTLNRITYALDWIDARASLPRTAGAGDAPEVSKARKFVFLFVLF